MTQQQMKYDQHFIINQLSGINLYNNEVQEPKSEYGIHWILNIDTGFCKQSTCVVLYKVIFNAIESENCRR